jgi:preprotein translocase subunit YajC
MTNFLLAMQENGGNWTLLIILGVFIVAMLAFSIIPQRRKQKQMAEMSNRIKVGDKVKTIGGIYGTVVDFDQENNVFTILSGNSTFEIDRGCVYSMEMLGVTTSAAAPAEIKEEPDAAASDTEKEALEKLAQKKEEAEEAKEQEEDKKE